MQAVRAASDSKSLVLLDEVGTGTEPVEGSALGVALLETLVKGGRGGAGFTMATTHHRWPLMLHCSDWLVNKLCNSFNWHAAHGLYHLCIEAKFVTPAHSLLFKLHATNGFMYPESSFSNLLSLCLQMQLAVSVMRHVLVSRYGNHSTSPCILLLHKHCLFTCVSCAAGNCVLPHLFTIPSLQHQL